ncbi:hypothetical protein LTR37_020080 [Vermiconidia calcicola]|uniref:Uncharacterized protein n=1 Tax=Vermiconidia calcicola TaxID=1690605 RepID=A0ACC3ME77_9PEZI|nr:hypothetical protein LTR37_020080 [Vermiconidia calcicola]
MSQSISIEAETFARSYAALFASPAASSAEGVADLATEIGRYYRPAQTQAEAAKLIETEMRNNIFTGLGTKLILETIEKIVPYSETSALCWLRWSFHPQEGSEFEGRGWTFTNIYAFRAASADLRAGWEFVVRDQEVNEIRRVTGRTFEGS